MGAKTTQIQDPVTGRITGNIGHGKNNVPVTVYSPNSPNSFASAKIHLAQESLLEAIRQLAQLSARLVAQQEAEKATRPSQQLIDMMNGVPGATWSPETDSLNLTTKGIPAQYLTDMMGGAKPVAPETWKLAINYFDDVKEDIVIGPNGVLTPPLVSDGKVLIRLKGFQENKNSPITIDTAAAAAGANTVGMIPVFETNDGWSMTLRAQVA